MSDENTPYYEFNKSNDVAYPKGTRVRLRPAFFGREYFYDLSLFPLEEDSHKARKRAYTINDEGTGVVKLSLPPETQDFSAFSNEWVGTLIQWDGVPLPDWFPAYMLEPV